MTMQENAANVMQVQQQIRANASELQDYFSDLYKWETSINQTDEAKKKSSKPRASNLPRVRAGAQVTTASSTKAVEDTVSQKNTKESAGAHTYDKGYKKWEKFDVDAVLRDMDDDSRPTNNYQEPVESASSTSSSIVAPSTTRKIVVEAPCKDKNDIGKSREQIEREDGNEHYKNGDYVAAIKCYTRCLGYNAQNAVVLSNRAMAYLKNREYSKAEDDCTLALKIDPEHVKSYSRRGTARNSLGKHRLALLDFEKAAELDPKSKQINTQIIATQDLIKAAIKRAPKRSDIKIQVVESNKNDSKKSDPTESSEPIEMIGDKENVAHNVTPKTGGIIKKETKTIKPILKTSQEPPPAPLGASTKEKPVSAAPIQKTATTTTSSTSLPKLPKKAPTSSYEFGRVWKTLALKGDAQRKKELLELQGEFIRKIAPKTLPSVFKNSIESDLLCELFRAIRYAVYEHDKSFFVFDFVVGMTKVPRFSMMISFLTKKEKEDIEWVFNELTKDKGATEVEAVKKLYEL